LSEEEITSAFIATDHFNFCDPSTKNENITKFDNFILFIIHMCDKHGSRLPENELESLWIHAIKSLYKIKQVVFERSGSELGQEERENFTAFHMMRIQEFMRRMSEHVNLRKILEFLDEIGH